MEFLESLAYYANNELLVEKEIREIFAGTIYYYQNTFKHRLKCGSIL